MNWLLDATVSRRHSKLPINTLDPMRIAFPEMSFPMRARSGEPMRPHRNFALAGETRQSHTGFLRTTSAPTVHARPMVHGTTINPSRTCDDTRRMLHG
jgi:hypothetical protein